jgi:hypothetical protein
MGDKTDCSNYCVMDETVHQTGRKKCENGTLGRFGTLSGMSRITGRTKLWRRKASSIADATTTDRGKETAMCL